ncbi:MAG TPA: AMP-binding protein [Acetobacteraceae bacterium]|nr:AMP-binding protein [Acetobacteraceae bacterium]
MAKLTDCTSYQDGLREFSSARLWDLFDGDRTHLNIAHECIDRHAADSERVAIWIAFADGHDERLTFRAIARGSAQFAHWLQARGIGKGERVAIMLQPSFAFYAAVFGAMKAGAVAVPLFTLFGPHGVKLRIDDCSPRMLLTNAEKARELDAAAGVPVVVADDAFLRELGDHPTEFEPHTSADDMAIYQYTSGTTRELPEAVRHTHRAIVTLMVAALYGTGIRPGDRFFCPSSPAWGHGLWHGTLAPLAMGVHTGTFSGKFDAAPLLRALHDSRTTNLSAAATHYRLIKSSGAANRYDIRLEKMSFTGEPIDSDTLAFAERLFHTRLCSMYGTTEVGVLLVNYPGADDFIVKPGALGKPVPAMQVEVQRPDGTLCGPDEIGEIKVWRRNAWFSTKDRGFVDADGYFYHAGRADDVIISAGWTIGAVEVEDTLLKHPAVKEAAVIGVPDATRGQVVKAFIVTDRAADPALAADIQDFVRTRLSQHEYPRLVAFVSQLPRTPAGKVNRKALRDREAVSTA